MKANTGGGLQLESPPPSSNLAQASRFGQFDIQQTSNNPSVLDNFITVRVYLFILSDDKHEFMDKLFPKEKYKGESSDSLSPAKRAVKLEGDDMRYIDVSLHSEIHNFILHIINFI